MTEFHSNSGQTILDRCSRDDMLSMAWVQKAQLLTQFSPSMIYRVVGGTDWLPFLRPRLIAEPRDDLIFTDADTKDILNIFVRFPEVEGIHLVTLKGILVHLLQNHGFEVSEKDDILFGEKEGQLVILGFTDECTAEFLTDIDLRFRDSDSNIIIASMKEPRPGVHDHASALGIS